jgi:sugar phosphate isomerase/epimerase
MTIQEFADLLKASALGEDGAQSAENLRSRYHVAAQTGAREMRELAALAAAAGIPIIGGPRGYFYARTREEAEAAIRRLESHAKAELHHASLYKRMLDNAAQTHLFPAAAAL